MSASICMKHRGTIRNKSALPKNWATNANEHELGAQKIITLLSTNFFDKTVL